MTTMKQINPSGRTSGVLREAMRLFQRLGRVPKKTVYRECPICANQTLTVGWIFGRTHRGATSFGWPYLDGVSVDFRTAFQGVFECKHVRHCKTIH